MLNHKYSSTFLAGLLAIGITIVSPEISSATTTRIDQLKTNTTNQLLRVSLEPGYSSNEVNVYLYTTNSTPVLNERYLTKDIYAIELLNTTIATTNNINISSVKDKVGSVKIVPFINTSKPLKTGLARIILKTKSPKTKYNIIVKPIEIKVDNKKEVTTQVYYPPEKESHQPQSMAFFEPPDNKMLAQLPEETLIAQDPDEIPEIDINEDDKLTVSPKNEPPPVFEEDSVNNLPDIGSPVTSPTPVPDQAQDLPGETAPTTPAQGSQNPPPEPTVDQKPVSVWPKDIAKIVQCVCLPIVILLGFTICVLILKVIRGGKQKQAFDSIKGMQGQPGSGEGPPVEGFEPIEEGVEPEPQEMQNYSPDEPQPLPADIASKLSNEDEASIIPEAAPAGMSEEVAVDPFAEDVEEVILIDSFDISDTKSLYLVEAIGSIALMGVIGEEVMVLNKFQAHELPSGPQKMIVSKEGTIIGKEIYHVKINGWEGVVASENNHLTLHTDLSI